MKKVRVLLSGNSYLQNYVEAFSVAGAMVTAKYLPEIDMNYDGLVLCGGSDIHPKYYYEDNLAAVGIDEKRDEIEFELLNAYVKAGKPVLGICRGHQLLNVYFGGSLYQDIPGADLHRRHQNVDAAHLISATPESILATLYGESFSVNSNHHQAIKEIGKGLVATAWWNNQYIEAIEHTHLPVLGVQFHPERMCCGRKRDDTVDGLKLFEAFLQMCNKGK